MDEDDYALSQLLLYAGSHSSFSESPTASPAPASLSQVQQRPISKRRGKKRSSRACGACRARKVRCNIVAHGAPCSNCRHDEVDCVLPLSRRQKSARERMEREAMEQGMRLSSFSADVEDCIKVAKVEVAPEAATYKSASLRSPTMERANSISETPLGPYGMAISEHPLTEILPVSRIKTPQPDIPRPLPTSSRTKSWIQIVSPLASAPIIQNSSSDIPRIPAIFAPFPRHLDAHDLTYLYSRGALTLPTEPLQIALLKAYVEFVHPNSPLLDLEDFLSMVKYGITCAGGEKGNGSVRENAGKKQISFLLFQAVMFAAVEFVALHILKEAGYKSREGAKTAFFARVRLLYDFDTTIDRLSIIQSLLLMTRSTPSSASSHDGKDAWHWLGLAISLSYSLGLNRRNCFPSTDLRLKHLERRVWWMTFIRDRELVVSSESGCRKSMRIKRVDCDTEMLSMEDFELPSDGFKDDGNEIEEVKMRWSAQACVEKARLCWRCDEILVSSYSAIWTPLPPFSLAPPVQPSISASISNSPNMDMNSTQPLQTATYSEREIPAFESQEDLEYHFAPSSSTPSADDNCVTPREYEDDEFLEEDDNPTDEMACGSPLGGGYGVDGEYDDYFEFLKGTVISERKEKERSSWAFQLDCENGRVVEV